MSGYKDEFNPALMVLLYILTVICPLVGIITAAVNWQYTQRREQCQNLLGVGIGMIALNLFIIFCL